MIYTKEFVIEQIDLLLKTLREDKSIVYIWELFENKDYTRQRYNEWISKPRQQVEWEPKDRVSRYWDDENIIEKSSAIKEILETRAITGAMTNKLNATSTIFHLKNNYKWVDKSEVDNNNTNADITDNLSEEQKKKLASRYWKLYG